MKFMVLAAIAALSFAPSADAAIQNLVLNGDFAELSNGLGQPDFNTTLTHWTNDSGSGFPGYNFVMNDATVGSSGVSGLLTLWTAANGGSSTWDGKAASGSGNFAALDGAYQTGPLSQTITGLVVGKIYKLTFDYAFAQQRYYDGATIQSLDAIIGNGSVGFTTFNTGNVDLANHAFSGWTTKTVSFQAKDTSEVLSFFAHGNLPVPPFALLSNVVIPAPELGTWAMMIVGLGAVGMTVRRRQKIALPA